MSMRPGVTVSGLTSVLELEKQGHYSRALRLVEALLPMEGQSAALLAAKARLLTSQGKLTDALRTAELTIDLWPMSPSGHAARAEALESAERHAEALAAADQALKLDALDLVALRSRAMSLAELGRGEEATRMARQAVALAPDDPDCVLTLGLVLIERDRAAALREIAVLVDGHRTPATLAARGMIRALAEDFPGAEQDAAEAVSLDPDDEAAGLVAMTVDLMTERWDDVLARAGVPPLQDNLTAQFSAGLAYQSSGRPGEAAAALVGVIEQQPRNLTALTLLRGAQLDLGDWPQLSLTCSRMLAVTPDDPDTLVIRARALCEMDNPTAALRDVDRVLAQDPGAWPALAIRSLAQLMMNRPAQALTDANTALAGGAGADSLAASGQMLALLSLGRRREAEEAARRILRERPGDSVARQIVEAAEARWNRRVEDLGKLAKTALQFLGS